MAFSIMSEEDDPYPAWDKTKTPIRIFFKDAR